MRSLLQQLHMRALEALNFPHNLNKPCPLCTFVPPNHDIGCPNGALLEIAQLIEENIIEDADAILRGGR